MKKNNVIAPLLLCLSLTSCLSTFNFDVKEHEHVFESTSLGPSYIKRCTYKDCNYGVMPDRNDMYDKMIDELMSIDYNTILNDTYFQMEDIINCVGPYDPIDSKYDKNSELVDKNSELKNLMNSYVGDMNSFISQLYCSQILYNSDSSNEKLKQQYADIHSNYLKHYEGYLTIFHLINDSKLKEYYFYGMNQEQINNYLKNNDPEITSLKNEQERIKLEYQNIEDVSESNKVLELFDDYVEINNKLANKYEYSSFVDYSYAETYNRDYIYKDTLTLVEYYKKYLTPVFEMFYQKLSKSSALTDNDSYDYYHGIVNNKFFDNYYSNKVVNDYMNSLVNENEDLSFKSEFEKLFEDGNYFLAEDSPMTAYEARIPTFRTPILFFSGDYQNAFTVVHEFGHYMNDKYNSGYYTQSYDLLETHSQGNEMLFLSYLINNIPELAANLILNENIYSTIATSLVAMSVNLFEIAIYTNTYNGYNSDILMKDGKITSNEYDLLFESILTDFNIKDKVNNKYWRLVVFNSPGYYISYSTSAISSLQLLILSETQGYQKAIESYYKLFDYTDYNNKWGYNEVLSYANLTAFNDEKTYQTIYDYFSKY